MLAIITHNANAHRQANWFLLASHLFGLHPITGGPQWRLLLRGEKRIITQMNYQPRSLQIQAIGPRCFLLLIMTLKGVSSQYLHHTHCLTHKLNTSHWTIKTDQKNTMH